MQGKSDADLTSLYLHKLQYRVIQGVHLQFAMQGAHTNPSYVTCIYIYLAYTYACSRFVCHTFPTFLLHIWSCIHAFSLKSVCTKCILIGLVLMWSRRCV